MGSARVGERWPVFARQVRDALLRDGESELAGQVDGLSVVQACDCREEFCQSFCTEAPPGGAYPMDRHRNWYTDDPGWDGYLVLDVVDGRIVFVEVLYRSGLDLP